METASERGVREVRVGSRLLVLMALAIPLTVTQSANALASTRSVDTLAGVDTGDCTGMNTCKTIGYAVSQASNGDTIQIAAGTYTEAVSTGLNLTFTGAGAGATTIDSTGHSAQALALSGTASVSNMSLVDHDSGIGGALWVSGSATVSHVSVTTDGQTAGTDGILASGTSLSLSDSTISTTNTDADVANNPVPHPFVVTDGSAIEFTAGTLSVTRSTLSCVEGIALRMRSSAGSATVRDSRLESGGAVPAGISAPKTDEWPTVQVTSGSLALTFDTVVNQTTGQANSQAGAVPADALWVATSSANPITVTIADSILHAQPSASAVADGADIRAQAVSQSGPGIAPGAGTVAPTVTATASAYTTINAPTSSLVGGGTVTPSVTAIGTAGNVLGEPGFANAGTGDFSLAAGSALIGAGDASQVTGGETDIAGQARDNQACTPAAVNIGAYETAAPGCPQAPPNGNSIGALTQLGGAANCVTGDSTANTGCNTAAVPGLGGGAQGPPQDAVISPDGRNVYAVAQDATNTGVALSAFRRTSSGLAPLLSPGNCLSGGAAALTGCGTGGVASLQYGGTPVSARLAISPDGKSVYVDNGSIISEFSRDPASGALTPLDPADCVESGSADASCSASSLDRVGSAAALVVSPDSRTLYLATVDMCSRAVFLRRPALDSQNANCRNDSQQYFASADVAVFQRDTSTGVLTPGPCYSNANTQAGNCSTTGIDALYGITSLALSPDGADVYVTSDARTQTGTPVEEPGAVSEFSRDPSSGALTPLSGAGRCITAAAACDLAANDPGSNGVAGLTDPQQIVISPDGNHAYVTSAQYLGAASGPLDTGTLANSTLTQLARDPVTGALSPLNGARCYAGYHEACMSGPAPSSAVTQVPGLTGAEGLAISPDGQSVYVSAQTGSDSVLAEFSRATGSGLLTPLSAPDTCIGNGQPPGGSGAFACGTSNAAGLAASVADLPGRVLVSPDCTNVYALSSGIAEFGRSVPQGASGCSAAGAASSAQLSTFSLSFGTGAGGPVRVGTTSATQSVVVSDAGLAPLSFGTATLSGSQASQFSIASDTCSGQTIQPAHSCAIAISFSPEAATVAGAQLSIADGASDSPQGVSLSGLGGLPAVTTQPSALTFGDVAAGQTTPAQGVTVTNSGNLPLHVSGVTFSGSGASRFALTNSNCQTVAVGASCSFAVDFSPAAPGTVTASALIADDAPGSPQAVSLTGTSVVGTVVGTVYDGRTAGARTPLGGASVSACSDHSQCSTTTTAADGTYALTMPVGGVTVSVWSGAAFYPASVHEQVTPNAAAIHDFVLNGPHALSGGVSINNQSGGVPTVNWSQPFTLKAPVTIPPTGPPGSTRLFTYVSGAGGNDGTDVGKGTYSASFTMFSVYYGQDGTPQAMSNPAVSPIACGPQDPNGPCAQFAAEAGVANGSSAASAAFRHRPVAHVAGDCPPAKPVGFDIVSNDFGGVDVTYTWPDGHQMILPLPAIAVPPMPSNGDLVHDFFFAVVGGGANLAINTLALATPFTAWIPIYNAIVGIANSLATVQGTNSTALRTMEDGNAFLSMVTSFGEQLHGPFGWFVQGMSAILGQTGNELTHSNSTVHFDMTPDCPPKHGDGYSDPSGVVKTTTGVPVAHAKVTLLEAGSRTSKPKPVPNGSVVMSPSNRHNPDYTDPLGAFGWDTLPGLFQVSAGHPGCSGTALTKLFPVPPPVSNLVLTLRCPHLRRAATRTQLKVIVHRGTTPVLLATVRPRSGRASPRQLLGTVTFRGGGRTLGVMPVNLANGTAVVAVPLVGRLPRTFTATYGGNGLYSPSSAGAR